MNTRTWICILWMLFTGAVASNGQTRNPRFSGSLFIHTPVLISYTKPYQIGGTARQRLSFTPGATLFLQGSHLPGGWMLSTRMQLQYRYSSTFTFARPAVLRIYQGMLSRHTSRTEIRVGRFYSTFERFSAYWDGMAFRYGHTDRYIGIAGGFLPDRWVEAPSFQMPRLSAFLQYERQVADLRAGMNLSFHEVRPQRTYLNHRYAGASLWLKSRFLRFSSDLQMDRDPENNEWKSSYWYNRLTLHLSSFSLTGRYAYRRFYSIWRTQQVFSPRRDQYELRIEAHPEAFSAGASITWNYYRNQLQGRSYYGHFGLPRLPLIPVGWQLSGSYWKGDGGSSLFASMELQMQRLLPFLQAIGAQFYRTDFLDVVNNAGALTLRGRITLLGRMRLTTNLRIQAGDYLSHISLYTGLWIPL